MDPADLRSSRRLVTLFGQAHRRGWVKRCEADKLAFFAAAEHALRVGTRNPGGLFAWLIRRGGSGGTGKGCTYVTHVDEDRARRRIAAHREGYACSGRGTSLQPPSEAGEEPFPFLVFPPDEEELNDLPADSPLPTSWLKGFAPGARSGLKPEPSEKKLRAAE